MKSLREDEDFEISVTRDFARDKLSSRRDYTDGITTVRNPLHFRD